MRFAQCTWHKPYAKQKMNIRTVYGCHLRWLNKCSAVAEMGDRLATIDMGRKLKGAVPLLGGDLAPHVTQCGLGRDLP